MLFWDWSPCLLLSGSRLPNWCLRLQPVAPRPRPSLLPVRTMTSPLCGGSLSPAPGSVPHKHPLHLLGPATATVWGETVQTTKTDWPHVVKDVSIYHWGGKKLPESSQWFFLVTVDESIDTCNCCNKCVMKMMCVFVLYRDKWKSV